MASDPNNQILLAASMVQNPAIANVDPPKQPQESKYHQNMPHSVGTVLIERFKILKVLGKGSFGVVYQVKDDVTGKVMALKAFKRKFASWEMAMRNAEVKAMIGLKHTNIVTCSEVLLHDSLLMIIFELLDMDLYRMMQMRKLNEDPFSHEEIRHIIRQIALGLDYIHQHGFFHRDIKPENILVQNQTTIKLGDFGLVKEIRHPTPFTEYVSTRWYRAPENVLGSRSYNYPVDIFALGCIMAELYTFRPLFPGSSEMDQFEKVSRILGKPSHEDWPDAKRLADRKLYNMPEHGKMPLSNVVPRASPEAISLMEWMLQYNPKKRPKPFQVIQHDFFMPKVHTGNKSSLMGTTAESSQQKSQNRVDSLVIGTNSIQLKSKLLEREGGGYGGPPFQSQLSLRNNQGKDAGYSPNMISPNNRKNNRQSIEATKLEPIDENRKGENQNNRQPTGDGLVIQKDQSQLSHMKANPHLMDPILAKDNSNNIEDHLNNQTIQEANSAAYKYAKLAGNSHTEVKNPQQAMHMNRTLNSRKFKNQSNSSQKAIPAFEQTQRTLDNSPPKGHNMLGQGRNMNIIQSKRNLNHSTIDSHSYNRSTNQNWLPKVSGQQNMIVPKFKNGALSPQPISNIQNQTLSNKFMQTKTNGLSGANKGGAQTNRDHSGKPSNMNISNYNQMMQQHLNVPLVGGLAVAGQSSQNFQMAANSTISHATQDQMKIQLPEIMQQQQQKIGQIKKQHNERFSNKKYLQLGVNDASRNSNYQQMGATLRDPIHQGLQMNDSQSPQPNRRPNPKDLAAKHQSNSKII